MKIVFVLKNVIMALESLHVLGRDAETLSGAMNALKNVIAAIEKAKEEQEHEDHDEQREDV